MRGNEGVKVVVGWLIGVAELYGWGTTGNGAYLGGEQWLVGWGEELKPLQSI